MDIILHNFIADMPGPYFLGFYALTIIATLILCWILKHVADYSRFLPTPSIPKQPDPYEIAYLRNGEEEVARVAVFNLIRQRLLEIVPDPANNPIQRVQQTSIGISSANQLSPMEHHVFNWFARPRRKSEVTSNELPSLVKPFCTDYQRRLEKEQLLRSPGMMSIITHWLILLLGILTIVGLGGYKLYVALIKGYHNIAFLIVMGIIAVCILIPVCKAPRLTVRGRKYLNQLQTAFESLKNQVRSETGTDDMAYLLVIGLFGTSILLLTPYADYYLVLQPPATTSSSGGCGGGGGCGGHGGGGCGGHGGGGHGGCGGCGGHGGH